MILTYQQALDYIHSFDDPYLAALRNHGQQTWGLERIRARLRELGDPHLAYPTIHIAGTKGKGSTSAFIAQGCIEAGLKTGLYISPHLQDWRERLQINRELITPDQLIRLVEDYQAIPTAIEGLSGFEVTTALAFWHFAREGCEVGVIEVGLGGRLDATSVVEPLVSVITNISLDHTQLLGETLGEIAGEKAAIIKQGKPVISAPQHPEARAVIEAKAAEMGSPLIVIGRDWNARVIESDWEGSEAEIEPMGLVKVGLPGAFQAENAAVAVAALRTVQGSLPIGDDPIKRGLSNIQWAGRLEVVRHDPLIVLDSAHNPYSIMRLIENLQILKGYEHLTFIFGCMADKHADAMLEIILPSVERIIFTQVHHARAAAPDDLQARAENIIKRMWLKDISLFTAEDAGAALQLAQAHSQAGDAICVAGSLALAGEARTALGLG